MLRISISENASDSAVLHLEGHLGGAWIAELSDTCERMLATGKALTLDLGDVSFIERSGLHLLASLSRRNVSFRRCSPFQREQLRRAGARHHDNTTTAP